MTIVPQRTSSDCGVASLAMYLGISYESVAAAVDAIYPRARHGFGMYGTWIKTVASEFGAELLSVPLQHYTPDEAHGIVSMSFRNTQGKLRRHFLTLYRGLAVCPDGPSVEPWLDYLARNSTKAYPARFGNLLTLADPTFTL